MRAAVIIDYQNMMRTGAQLFYPDAKNYEKVLDPFRFANTLIQVRNEKQKPGMEHVSLKRVFVYRGMPNASYQPIPNAYTMAQAAQWNKNFLVNVETRPLKYRHRYSDDGTKERDASGRYVFESIQEKGIDVMCALAVVREARKFDIEAVILASHDTDLIPALDEAAQLGQAKIETTSWYDTTQRDRCSQLRAGRPMWNTLLNREQYEHCLDPVDYLAVVEGR